MTIEVPTRAELVQRIKADYRLELGADPPRRSWENAATIAQMGMSKGLYGYLQWVQRQSYYDTADNVYFNRWMDIYGLPFKPAVQWQGTATATGTDETLIPAGSVLVRADGASYTVDATVAILGPTTIALTASTADLNSNNLAGQPLTFSPPIAGVASSVTVSATTTTGTDAESREDAEARLSLRLATPPQGGSYEDYVQWCLEVPGVTRAFPYLPPTPNHVWLICLRDNDGEGTAILPDATERQEIFDHVETRRPYTVVIQVPEVVAVTVNVEIAALTPDNPTVRAAVELSLKDLFAREGEPASEMALSRISAAISEAEGEVSHVLNQPSAAVVTAWNQVPILGVVTYV